MRNGLGVWPDGRVVGASQSASEAVSTPEWLPNAKKSTEKSYFLRLHMPQISNNRVSKKIKAAHHSMGSRPPAVHISRIVRKYQKADPKSFQDHRQCWGLQFSILPGYQKRFKRTISDISRIPENAGSFSFQLIVILGWIDPISVTHKLNSTENPSLLCSWSDYW